MTEDRDSGRERPFEPVNPYADAIVGTQPREIAEFELNTDPYANMLPRVSQRSSAVYPEDAELRVGRPRPWMIAISALLIVLLVVIPALTLIFERLGF